MKKQEVDIDKGFSRLEEIVSLLEHGSISLQESMALYEEGMALVKACSKRLDAMSSQVMMLQEQQGELIQKPLDEQYDDLE